MSRRRPLLPLAALDRRRFLGGTLSVAAAAGLPFRRADAQDKVVNVYNWDTYIGENTLEEFTEATGIKVRYDLYGSNEELFGKLREGNPGYDVVVPTDNYVQRMRAAGMLAQLDHALLPNLVNLAPRFRNPSYDPELAHSVPYFWGTLGLGFRSSKGTAESLAEIFETDKWDGRIALLADVDTLRMTFKYLGHSMNTTDPKVVAEAADALIRIKSKIKTFAPDTGQDLLLSGEVDVALEFSGDVLQVMEEDPDIGYRVPKEGGQIWTDNLCIAKGAPNPESAHAFINYILEPEVHAAIAEEIQYALPNEKARALLPLEMREDETIYPPEEVLERCELLVYQGEEVSAMYEEAFTRVLAS
ncbi:spermidine/putrescine ABC transporter substrate-binding protein [Geminicoccaceae bacterium 1502E]|nr:spermidine/putrescine ABC transporter substrate-binding protein [Geminicoccaceae bacterium 1502E]